MRVFPRSANPLTLMRFLSDNRKLISSFFKPKYNSTRSIISCLSNDCSIKDLIDKSIRFGPIEFPELREHLHEIAGGLFNGVYASDITELSSNICLKKCHHELFYSKFLKNKEYKAFEPNVKAIVKKNIRNSTSFTFEQGLQTLPQGILSYLEQKYPNNFKVHWNEEITSLNLNPKSPMKINEKTPYDLVISALPLKNLLEIVSKDKYFKSSKPFEILQSIGFKSLARVNFFFEKDFLPKELQSFGFLNLPKENEEVLGMTFDSKVFPSKINGNETRCSIMIGDDIVEKNGFNEKKLVDLAEKYLEKRLNIKEKSKDVIFFALFHFSEEILF